MKRIIGLLGALALFAAAPAWSEETAPVLSRIVSSGKLRVGMSGDQAPLNARTKSGEMIGLEVDLARAIASSMGVEAELVTRPFGELLGALEKGEVDVVMSGMTITPERNLRFAFVGPYFVSGKAILTKSKTLADADEAGDIDDEAYTLAALAGSTSQRFVEVFAPKAKLVTPKTYQEAVKLVLDDEATALVADYPVCVLALLQHPDADLATIVAPLTIEPLGIAVPPGDPLLVNFLENYLGALQATGLLEELQKKWFQSDSWVAQLPTAK